MMIRKKLGRVRKAQLHVFACVLCLLFLLTQDAAAGDEYWFVDGDAHNYYFVPVAGSQFPTGHPADLTVRDLEGADFDPQADAPITLDPTNGTCGGEAPNQRLPGGGSIEVTPTSTKTKAGQCKIRLTFTRDNKEDDTPEKWSTVDKWVVAWVEIKKPIGSLTADPQPDASWITDDCNHFDFLGVTTGSPEPYTIGIEGEILPTSLSYEWTLDAAAGTLTDEETATPDHAAPAAAGEGTLKLTAMDGETDTGLFKEKELKIYTDHLDRDKAIFGTGGSCDNPWSITSFDADKEITSRWNCHGAVIHAYDGTGTGSSQTTVSWTVIKTCNENEDLGTLTRGDVIAYYDKNATLMHSQTFISGTTTWGANNEPPPAPGTPAQQSWKWAESEAGKWAANVGATWKPITIKVLDRP